METFNAVDKKKTFENIVEKRGNAGNQVFSSTGRRPASLCHGPLSVVRPSILLSVHPSVC